MRLAFMGASGTGKTAIADHVIARYGLELNPVGSRSVAKAMGYASPYDVDADDARDEFQRRLVAEKREWEDSHDSFVTDRTTLDNLAYSILHGVRDVDSELWTSAMEGMRRYNAVVFFPVAAFCNPGDDPARVKDITYHHAFEAVLRGLLGMCNEMLVPDLLPLGRYSRGRTSPFPTCVLTMGDLEERKRAIDYLF